MTLITNSANINPTDSEPSREAVEALAIEGYRSGALSDVEVAHLLNLSISETDDFLRTRGLFAFENLEVIKPGLICDG